MSPRTYHRTQFKNQYPGILLQAFGDEGQHVFMTNIAVHPGFVQEPRFVLQARILVEDLDCHCACRAIVLYLAFYHLRKGNSG